jgi:hypothetical protein
VREKLIYKEKFPIRCEVIVAGRTELQDFLSNWKLHNPLQESQLEYADKKAVIESVGFYHGGDVLYKLEGIPGIWHERCLRASI